LHNNADALSCLPSHQDAMAVIVDQVVLMVAVTCLLPAYSLQNCQLEDDLVGRAKEAGKQPQSGQEEPSWRKMAQLWDQLLIKVSCAVTLRM